MHAKLRIHLSVSLRLAIKILAAEPHGGSAGGGRPFLSLGTRAGGRPTTERPNRRRVASEIQSAAAPVDYVHDAGEGGGG